MTELKSTMLKFFWIFLGSSFALWTLATLLFAETLGPREEIGMVSQIFTFVCIGIGYFSHYLYNRSYKENKKKLKIVSFLEKKFKSFPEEQAYFFHLHLMSWIVPGVIAILGTVMALIDGREEHLHLAMFANVVLIIVHRPHFDETNPLVSAS